MEYPYRTCAAELTRCLLARCRMKTLHVDQVINILVSFIHPIPMTYVSQKTFKVNQGRDPECPLTGEHGYFCRAWPGRPVYQQRFPPRTCHAEGELVPLGRAALPQLGSEVRHKKISAYKTFR